MENIFAVPREETDYIYENSDIDMYLARKEDERLNATPDNEMEIEFISNSHHFNKLAQLIAGNRFDTVLPQTSPEQFEKELQTALAEGFNIDTQTPIKKMTLLHLAVIYNPNLARILLQNHAYPNIVNCYDSFPLRIAIKNRDNDLATDLIQAGAVINEPNYRMSPLRLAVITGNVEVFHLLCDHGADITLSDNDGYNLLFDALFYNQKEMLTALLDAGADINSRKGIGFSLLHIAVALNRFEMLDELLARGCDINIQNNYGTTPLHTAIHKKNKEMIQLLVERGAYVNKKQDNGMSPLLLASFSCPEMIPYLIEHGATPRIADEKGDTCLHRICRTGDVTLARLLIEHGADINAQSNDGDTPLHAASYHGHLEIVQLLIAQNAKLNILDTYEKTPLHEAIIQNHLDIVKELVESGASLKTRSKFDFIRLAISLKNADMAKYLIQNGACVHYQSETHNNLLHIASQFNCREIIPTLIEKGVDINQQTNLGLTPLTTAITSGHIDLAIELLTQYKANPMLCNIYGENALHYAAAQPNTHKLLCLLKGMDIDSESENGTTPMMKACIHNQVEAMETLYQLGANPNYCNKHIGKLRHPMMAALQYESIDAIKWLLNHHVDPNDPTSQQTPFIQAMKKNNFEIMDILLANGADINRQNSMGISPLHYAVAHNQNDIVTYLLSHQANPNGHDFSGVTPLMLAILKNNTSAVQILLEQDDIDVNQQNNHGWSALHYAVEQGNLPIVQALLNKKVNLNLTTDTHLSSLMLAARYGHSEIIQTLIKDGACVNQTCPNGLSAVHYAAYFQNITALCALVAAGGDLEQKTCAGFTPLEHIKKTGLLVKFQTEIQKYRNS